LNAFAHVEIAFLEYCDFSSWAYLLADTESSALILVTVDGYAYVYEHLLVLMDLRCARSKLWFLRVAATWVFMKGYAVWLVLN